MAQVIPLKSDGSRSVSVPLGDDIGIITFRTRFNSTIPVWTLDLFDVNGEPITYGLGLLPSHNLLRHLPVLERTIGDLRVIDIDGNGNKDPDRLGSGVGLMHYKPGEFQQLYPDFDTPSLAPLNYNIDDLFTTTPPAIS